MYVCKTKVTTQKCTLYVITSSRYATVNPLERWSHANWNIHVICVVGVVGECRQRGIMLPSNHKRVITIVNKLIVGITKEENLNNPFYC